MLSPQKNGEPRRRDYIGCDAKRIEDARADIVRAHEYDRLAAQHAAFTDRARGVAAALHDARRYLAGKV